MSDIYLQITETPTVVTLSAPVVSGALASTVTVANTVTVALDSNSLSALENVTVTVGAAITGTVTVANFPATQAVSLASVPTHGVTLASTTVTVSSLPAISGTVTAMAGTNFANEIYNGIFNFSENDQLGVYVTSALPAGSNNIGRMTIDAGTNRIGVVTIGGGTVTIGAGTAQIGSVTASISGTVPVSGTFFQATQPVSLTSTTVTVSSLPALAAGTAQIGSVTASISGTVPISISSVTVGNSVTIGSLPAISGTVTANVPFFNFGEGVSDGAGNLPIYGIQIGYADSISGEFQLVADNKPLPISGTVTANSSNGSLTTRFGSVTTANTAFATSAVTNANRKYLLIQNITTASNVITVGIGFTPTTTQGIQLFAGAGLTFEGSYIPTGAVNLLSSVTASCYTILEA